MAELLLKWRVRKLTGHCGERSFRACLYPLRIVLLCGVKERRGRERKGEEEKGEKSGDFFERCNTNLLVIYVNCIQKYSIRP